ncbi:Neurochondrin-domain-containing protein [Jimgerdemannia flammicorona]|uniref:Neurochondrin-domain-containing protein n=1 Tax=Jimgerdemannia flammicorona TaxID=994334 RepID=A0A433QFY7_9FUNG|nr:Neurochondrin-domain-containing protein [Jimgerdemannia flammicorona]
MADTLPNLIPTDDDLNHCLALLAPSATDESKFVALLLLPRLLDQKDPQTMHRVFAGMNFGFLERLMKTKSQQEAEIPEETLKSIAVNILSCFCSEELIQTKQMTARISTLAGLITPNFTTVKDGLFYRNRKTVGSHAIASLQPSHIIHHLTLQPSPKSFSATERTLTIVLLRHVHLNASAILASAPSAHLSSLLKESLRTVMLPSLTALVRTRQDAVKFEALGALREMIEFVPGEILHKIEKEEPQRMPIWTNSIRVGLRQILGNSTYRETALTLIALLLRHFGTGWLFRPITAHPPSARRIEKSPAHKTPAAADEEADARFSALVVQLACVETRLLLDKLQDRVEGRRRVEGEREERKEGEREERKEGEREERKEGEREEREDKMLPVCYEILEAAIRVLSEAMDAVEKAEEGEEGSNDGTFDAELLLRMQEALVETFRAVLEYLKDVQDNHADDMKAILADMTALASVRVLASWLAEEASLEKEIAAVMRLLVGVCHESTSTPTPIIDLTSLLTPAFLNLTSSAFLRLSFLSAGGHIAMASYVRSAGPAPDRVVGPMQVLAGLAAVAGREVVGDTELVKDVWEGIGRFICGEPGDPEINSTDSVASSPDRPHPPRAPAAYSTARRPGCHHRCEDVLHVVRRGEGRAAGR